MTLVPMRPLLDHAAVHGYGLGAFNVQDLLQAEAVLEAARATASPVIVQTLSGGSAHGSDAVFWPLLHALCRAYDDVRVALHLDHGPSPERCVAAMDAGFTSVMMDGSLRPDRRTPATFAENVAVTRTVVELAHARAVTVEGELGTIGGVEGGAGADGDAQLTDPDEAQAFVDATGIDALAVAIGTSHGTYKFDREPDGEILRMDLIAEIHRRLPDVHLVMHGSSSVPEHLVAVVNAHGGRIRRSWGVPTHEKQVGIRHGVRKINVGTDSFLAVTGAVRAALASDPETFEPIAYLRPAREAMQRLCEQRMHEFGQAGMARVDAPALAEGG
jgi:fructose-bisphosphate aldolase class II